MTTTTHDRPLSAASDAYLAAVGAALVGVPESDRQELLDDLAEHLGELADESDAGLIARLGPPPQYAAELLASAGIVPAASAAPAGAKLVERVRTAAKVLDAPSLQHARVFWTDVRPGWWVVRAWLVLAAIAARSGLQEALWIPNLTGKPLVDFALLVGAVIVSVRIGRGANWAAWIATALGLIALVSVLGASRSYFYRVNDTGAQSFSAPGVLTDPSGREIDNVFAYNASGKPIGPVFLFDQNGVPLDVGNSAALQDNGIPFISGLFPQPIPVTNDQGVTRGVQPKPPRVEIPKLPQLTSPTAGETTKPKAAKTTPTTALPAQQLGP